MRATVSGSFHRAMPLIQDAVHVLVCAGVQVLSPADPRIVDQFGDFLFVASDRLRTIRLVEDRHLAAIENSTFVWLVVPDGYVGQSAAMEIGYAAAKGIPVYAASPPADWTLRQYVTTVANPLEAVLRCGSCNPRSPSLDSALLLDPAMAAERAHRQLEAIERRLSTADVRHREDDPALRDRIADLASI